MAVVQLGQHDAPQLARALAGTCHHVGKKDVQRYLASFAWRFNRRYQFDTMTERLMWAALKAEPRPYRA